MHERKQHRLLFRVIPFVSNLQSFVVMVVFSEALP